jgi:hypothetical protein
MPILGECFDYGIRAKLEAEQTDTTRRLPTTYPTGKLAGVTGLEPESFRNFIEEIERFLRYVHNWAHKNWAHIVTNWRGLAQRSSLKSFCGIHKP